jgi:hypothetical protein
MARAGVAVLGAGFIGPIHVEGHRCRQLQPLVRRRSSSRCFGKLGPWPTTSATLEVEIYPISDFTDDNRLPNTYPEALDVLVETTSSL